MINLIFSLGLISSVCASENVSPQQPTPPATQSSQNTYKGSFCDDLGRTLIHIQSDKAKSIIAGFCAAGNGDAIYVDKMQVTINVQGDDANYDEKYKYVYDPVYDKSKTMPSPQPDESMKQTSPTTTQTPDNKDK